MEQGFTAKEAKQERFPSTRERIDLAKLYLSLVDPTWLQQFDFNPLEVALSHCNSYFLFALHAQPESSRKTL